MTLAQADQILDRGVICPPRAVVDQKNPGQLGLKIKMHDDDEPCKWTISISVKAKFDF